MLQSNIKDVSRITVSVLFAQVCAVSRINSLYYTIIIIILPVLSVIYVFIFEPSLKHGVCSEKKEENRLFLKIVGLGMILLQAHPCSIQV